MEPTETIGTLKQKIQHAKGIAVNHQKLSLEGAPLSLLTNECALLECGIGSRSTLLLESVVCQQMQIFLLMLTGKTKTFEVKPADIVWELKLNIHKTDGIPPDHQRLIYAGKQLEDRMTLSHYGIKAYSKLNLILQMKGGGGSHNRTYSFFH